MKEMGEGLSNAQLNWCLAVRIHLNFQKTFLIINFMSTQTETKNLATVIMVLLGEERSCLFSILEYKQQKVRDTQGIRFH